MVPGCSRISIGHMSKKVRRDEGMTGRRYDGTKVRRDEGTTGRRYDGTKVRRDEGTMGRRYDGTSKPMSIV